MRKTSKVISLLLTVAMMVTMVIPMTVSAAFSDVSTSHHYYEAIMNLSSEGILNGFEDGSFKPEEPVTRAQFTKIICYALGVGNLTYSEAERSVFTDLDPNHWAANNIVTAYNQKIINGMGDGTFAPESGVQYEQAVKMAVCAIGYGNRALSLGEYPNGYMQMANQLKLLKGITDAKMYQVMNRGAVAQLIDNMLDAEQLQDGEPGGSIREETSTTQTAEGRVVANRDIRLNNEDYDYAGKNEILIESGSDILTFDISELSGFDIDKFLGRGVVVYYVDEPGVTVDVASNIVLQSRGNEETTIDLDMIADCTDSVVEYYTSDEMDDTDKVSYESDIDVIYNGAAINKDVTSLKKLIAENANKPGYVTLISSLNGDADVAFVKAYETMVVGDTDQKTKTIYGMSGSIYTEGIVLDPDSKTKNVTIKNKNGSTVSFGSIAVNNVLSIAADGPIKTATVIEVIVCNETKTGKISATTNNGNTITINDVDYDLAEKVVNVTGGELEVGNNVSIGLDAFGRIAKYSITAKAGYVYGYLSDLETYPNKDEIKVEVYKLATSAQTATPSYYSLGAKVKIDGTPYYIEDEMSEIAGELEKTAKIANAGLDAELLKNLANETYAQPIRFTTSSSGVIDNILTLNKAGDNATSLNIQTLNPIKCTVDGQSFGEYRVSGSTPVIYVPANRTTGTYSTKNATSYFNEGDSYYVQFANVNSNTKIVDAVYVYGIKVAGSDSVGGDDTSSITEQCKPMVVISSSEREVNGEVKKYFLLRDILTGEENEYYDDGVTGTEKLKDLVAGDVIRIAADDSKNIQALEIVAVATDVIGAAKDTVGIWEVTDGDGEGANAEYRTVIATIKTREGNEITYVHGYDAEKGVKLESANVSSAKVHMVTTNANGKVIVEESIASELNPYNSQGDNASRVLIYMEENVIKSIVIFE